MRLLFSDEDLGGFAIIAPEFKEDKEEEEEREFVEVMDDVELEREWRQCWPDVVVVWLSGELGHELCGEVGGVGRMGGRSAGVSCITLAKGDMGTPAHSPSALITTVV